MDERKPRKRIPISKPALPALVDPLQFTKNKASNHARIETTINEKISIDLWFDKHYVDRHQHGDDNGKRDGIDKENVKKLALESLKHLLFYSAYIKNFTFLNHNYSGNNSGNSLRIVCQKEIDGELLNAVIEVHFKLLNEFEITVKTAMRNNDFKLSEGQYAIEIFEEDSSVLKQMVKGKIQEIFSV